MLKGPNGRDLGDPAHYPEEEELRRAILGQPSYRDELAAEKSIELADEMVRRSLAGDGILSQAHAAYKDAVSLISKPRNVMTRAEAHRALALSDGAIVRTIVRGAPAGDDAQRRVANQFIGQLISKGAAPPGITITVLRKGDRLPFDGARFTGRSLADSRPGRREMFVAADEQAPGICHEFAHIIEAESGAHLRAAVEFVCRRRDTFKRSYTAKVYRDAGGGVQSYRGIRATEVISTGLQRIVEDVQEFAWEDPDHFRVTLALLRMKATPPLAYSDDQPRGPDGRFGSGGGGANGRDLGDPKAQPREEAVRQKILAVHSKAEKAQAEAKEALTHANKLIREVNAGDASKLPAAKAARGVAIAKNDAAKQALADAAAQTHKLISVPDGAKVNATASAPLANGGAEAKAAGDFLSQCMSRDAAPASVHLQVLKAGDTIATGTFEGRTFKGRAHADPIAGRRSMTVSPDVKAATIVHEFGHVTVAESGAHMKVAVDFLLQRTAGTGAAKQLSELTGNANYGPKEKALQDDFSNPYTGKTYEASGPGSYRGLGAEEVFSMGIERMMTDPKGFALNDPHHFRTTLQLMSLKATPRMELKG
jgi:hypothetical protein